MHLDGLCVGPKELVVSALQASFARRPHDEDMGGFDFRSNGISPQDVWPTADTQKTEVIVHDVSATSLQADAIGDRSAKVTGA